MLSSFTGLLFNWIAEFSKENIKINIGDFKSSLFQYYYSCNNEEFGHYFKSR